MVATTKQAFEGARVALARNPAKAMQARRDLRDYERECVMADRGHDFIGDRRTIASEEHFDRWWKSLYIVRRAKEDESKASLLESYRAVAHSAWITSAGRVPLSVRDERIERLEQRAQYLRMKIFNDGEHQAGFKRAELSALEWAIPIVICATSAAPRG